jgi:hypothetical protein
MAALIAGAPQYVDREHVASPDGALGVPIATRD